MSYEELLRQRGVRQELASPTDWQADECELLVDGMAKLAHQQRSRPPPAASQQRHLV